LNEYNRIEEYGKLANGHYGIPYLTLPVTDDILRPFICLYN